MTNEQINTLALSKARVTYWLTKQHYAHPNRRAYYDSKIRNQAFIVNSIMGARG